MELGLSIKATEKCSRVNLHPYLFTVMVNIPTNSTTLLCKQICLFRILHRAGKYAPYGAKYEITIDGLSNRVVKGYSQYSIALYFGNDTTTPML